MNKVLFIENTKNTEHASTRGVRIGAKRSGWNWEVVWIRSEDQKLRTPEQIRADIEKNSPNLIVWIMDSVLPVAEALESDSLKDIPKASLWFDDYERTYSLHKFWEKHVYLQNHCALRTFVWDGYWRKQFEKRFSIKTQPIHLAADAAYHFPYEATHFKGFEDSVIFIGNVPSLNHIREESSILPRSCSLLLEQTQHVISKSKYARLPYEALQEAYEGMSPKAKKVIDHFREDQAHQVLINRLAWMLGKREVRLRILRLASEQRELVILSGHSDKTFISKDEITVEFSQSKHSVKFISTDHVPTDQLGCIYHIGGLHLQATDPQSVEGGIPFRVFETTASARPLLSDFKPELADCFEPQKEILYFNNDEDFSEKLRAALSNRDHLKQIAEASYKKFLNEHTWQHRFEQIVRDSKVSSENSSSVKSSRSKIL